jgi:hypothetical protein
MWRKPVYSGKYLQSRGFGVNKKQISSVCMKRELPATEKNVGIWSSVIGRFHSTVGLGRSVTQTLLEVRSYLSYINRILAVLLRLFDISMQLRRAICIAVNVQISLKANLTGSDVEWSIILLIIGVIWFTDTAFAWKGRWNSLQISEYVLASFRNEPELLDTEHACYTHDWADYFTNINGNKQVM